MNEVKLNIYIIRHGEKSSDGNSLSEIGKKQVKLNKIFSSDLPRCIETTQIITKYVSSKLILEKSLREVDGQVKENPEKYPKEINRIKKFWKDLTKKEKGNVLLVSSGNVNRILLGIAMEISPKTSRFVQIPSGLTHLEFMGDKTRFVYVNDTSHLPEKLKIRQAY